MYYITRKKGTCTLYEVRWQHISRNFEYMVRKDIILHITYNTYKNTSRIRSLLLSSKHP